MEEKAQNGHRANPYKVTPLNAIRSKCHDCMGHYVDGRVDCENTACALYSYMPYAIREPDPSWARYNSKRAGLHVRLARELSDEERAAIADRLRKMREKK